MDWDRIALLAAMLGVSFLLGKVTLHRNASLEASSPTVYVESWRDSPSCVSRPNPGDTLIVYEYGKAVAQVPIPGDTSYHLRLWANFRWQLSPSVRCSR